MSNSGVPFDGITFVSVPKAFAGHIGVIQTSAIESWKRLPGAEVILFGEEEGLREAAGRIGVRHEPEIARNRLGTPMVSDAFERARGLARSSVLAFVNTDIVFTSDLARAVHALASGRFPQWVMIGQRHDIDIREPIRMSGSWEQELFDEVVARGSLHGKSGIDFFVFPKDLPITLPPMAVGRVGWDSWLIYATRKARIPLVDATRAVCAIHQNHPPAHDPAGAEADDNRESAGGYYRMGSIRDADWQLIADESAGLTLAPRLAGQFWFAPPLRAGLAMKRAISRRLTGSRI